MCDGCDESKVGSQLSALPSGYAVHRRVFEACEHSEATRAGGANWSGSFLASLAGQQHA